MRVSRILIKELIATIGENMTLRRVAKVNVSDGVVAAYMHNAVAKKKKKRGVWARSGCWSPLKSTGDKEFLNTLGRQIAMHVAAVNPIASRCIGR